DVDRQPPATIILLTSELASGNNEALAIDLLRRILPRHASDFWLNHRLAFLLLKTSPPQTEAAVPYLAASVAIRPQRPGARVHLGFALMNLGRHDDAIQQHQEAIRLEPKYADAYNNLGASQLQLKRLDEAVANFRLSIK